MTWENALPAGAATRTACAVIRFPVARPRRIKVFADLSDEVFDGGAPRDRQEEWFRENGPETPALLEHLRAHGREFDLVVFWTFRYYPSYFGLPLVADRAVLVPTAEDDAAIDLDVLPPFFDKPAGYMFLTPEEAELVSSRALQPLRPSMVVGIGLEPVPIGETPRDADRCARHSAELPALPRARGSQQGMRRAARKLPGVRVDAPDVTLVLAGPAKMQVPAHPRIRALGYVSDEVREALLAHARALVVPSWYESLSIVLLEAWNHAVPALVNGRCKVLAGQVRRANGGLYYMFPAEFDEAADYLLIGRPPATRWAGRDSRTSIASIDGLRCCRAWSRSFRRLNDAQFRGFKAPVPEPVGPHVETLLDFHWPAIRYRNSSNACSRSVGDGTGALCGCE